MNDSFVSVLPLRNSYATKPSPTLYGFVISAQNAWSAKWIYKGFEQSVSNSLSVEGSDMGVVLLLGNLFESWGS